MLYSNVFCRIRMCPLHLIKSGQDPHDLAGPGGHDDVTAQGVHHIHRLYTPEIENML